MRNLCAMVILFISASFAVFAGSSDKFSTAIALTFDDGPRREVLLGSEGLLEFLAEENIKAAFFVQGWQAYKNPDLIREMAREGQLIANHTYNHATPREWARILATKDKKVWGKLGAAEKAFYIQNGRKVFLADAEHGRKAIQSLVGYAPLFMRPPKWDIDQELYCELSRAYIVQMIQGMVSDKVCPRDISPFHDVNTGDYEVIIQYVKGRVIRQIAVQKLIVQWRELVTRREARGLHTHVLVFHEHIIVVEALRVLIPEWKKQGIHFASLMEIYGL